MAKRTINPRHPSALQAELLRGGYKPPAPAPAPPPPPETPPAAPVSGSVAPPVGTLTLKQRLESLPDEDLIGLAESHDVESADTREDLIAALVAKNITLS